MSGGRRTAAGRLTLRLLPGRFAVARLAPDAAVPAWAWAGALSSVTRTARELSIVCAEAAVPAAVRAERGFRCLAVQGPLDFSATGVLAALATALADAAISLFALSTYDTDLVFVRESSAAAATAALRAAGHRVEEA